MFPNMAENYICGGVVSLYVYTYMHVFSLSLGPIIERFRYKPVERETEIGGRPRSTCTVKQHISQKGNLGRVWDFELFTLFFVISL